MITDPYFLYHEGLRYEAEEDVYHAVKLYKQAIRHAPNWSEPHQRLGRLYRQRSEWKPTLHYSQRAVELDPNGATDSWHDLALAATALKRWRTARLAWNKLGYSFRLEDRALNLDMGIVALQLLHPTGQREIVWARAVDPARAVLDSVPHPGGEFRYGDLVLHDREPCGYRSVRGGTVVVYEVREILRRGRADTFGALLHTANRRHLETLDRLCLDAEVGFDNWSGAIRQMTNRERGGLPEYFGREELPEPTEHFLVGMAANDRSELTAVLDAWRLITLCEYELSERSFL